MNETIKCVENWGLSLIWMTPRMFTNQKIDITYHHPLGRLQHWYLIWPGLVKDCQKDQRQLTPFWPCWTLVLDESLQMDISTVAIQDQPLTSWMTQWENDNCKPTIRASGCSKRRATTWQQTVFSTSCPVIRTPGRVAGFSCISILCQTLSLSLLSLNTIRLDLQPGSK